MNVFWVIGQMVLLAAMIFWPMEWADRWFLWIGLLLSFLGVLVVLMALLQLKTNLTPFPRPVPGGYLVTTGVYRWARHPIYAGLLLTCIGISMASLQEIRLVITLLLFLWLWAKSRYEEKWLLATYSAYKDYQKKTGRFWPRF